ncbi:MULTISPECIES: hypothetical protein [unclassified Butyrivibrio]|uniref:hypothetical protein n=1 Tax=unclassified Butyrivibrio TaxID=2639466 RepID=UPI0003B488D6|nr:MULTISPECIES: hypothetical protein [unclassified Butyrivibrio]SEM12752.1 hypothetical protein SAMN04487770_12672 [Butyrivibrio sp. ob235]
MNKTLRNVFAACAIVGGILLLGDALDEGNALLMWECIGIFLIGVGYLFPVKQAAKYILEKTIALKKKEKASGEEVFKSA